MLRYVRALCWLGLLLYSASAHANLIEAVCDSPEAVYAALEAGAAEETLEQAALDSALITLIQCGHDAQDPRWLDAAQALLNAGASAAAEGDEELGPLPLTLLSLSGGVQEINFYRDLARLLLAKGADPLSPGEDGNTPLHLASGEGDAAVTELLLELGADPMSRNNEGTSVLGAAAGRPDNLATFEKLLNQVLSNRDPDSLDLEALARRALTIHDHGKLNLLLQLDEAIVLPAEPMTMTLAVALWQGAPLPVAQRLAQAGADVALLPEQGGGDLAWRLASLGHESELDWLLTQGFDINRLPDSGIPPLYYASEQATKVLLAHGADVTLSSADLPPLAAALAAPPAPFDDGGESLTQTKLQQLLDAGYPVNLKDSDGLTALEHAVREETLWLAQALLRAGADPLSNSLGQASLLPLALQSDRLPLTQLLLRAIPDHAQRHPDLLLNYLSSADEVDPVVVEALLVAGTPLAARTDRGDNALLVSARLQHWNVVSMLLRYGADPLAANYQGCTLRCFEWSMPDPVRRELAAWLGGTPPWQPPALTSQPRSFFALAMVPVTALWLLWLAWRLHQRQTLMPPTLMFAASVISGILAGGALFFECDPCLLPAGKPQVAATATIALAFMILFLAHHWRTHRHRAP